MKNRNTKLSLFTLAIILAMAALAIGISAATQDLQETKMVNAAYGTPVVDGKLDDIWERSETIYFEYDRQGCSVEKLAETYEYENPNRKHWAKVMWDDTYLYVFFMVYDSAIYFDESIKTYNRDGIEFYVDEFNEKTLTKAEATAMNQVVINGDGSFCYGDKARISFFRSKATFENIPERNYYAIEAKYEFTTLAPYPGAVIGFDASINCNDTGEDKRDHCLSWNDRTNTTYYQPVYMGECTLGADGYDYAKDFDYEVNTEDPTTVTITEYKGNGGKVIVPETIDGYKVVCIDFYTFYECDRSISEITLPKTMIEANGLVNVFDLERINVEEGNEYLVSVDGILYSKDMTILVNFPRKHPCKHFDIPTGVEEMLSGAIFDAQGLESVTIPNSMVFIFNENFRYCDKLVSVTVPEGVKCVGGYSFANCESLESITFLSREIHLYGLSILSDCPKLENIYLYRTNRMGDVLDETKFAYLEACLRIGASDVKAVAGGTVKVDVIINSNPGIAGFNLNVEYDRELLTLKDIAYGEWICTSNFDDDPTIQPVSLFFYSASNRYETGVVATLTFEVNENAPLCKTNITLSPRDIVVDQELNEIECATSGGSITVTDSIPGDINSDGVINTGDAVLLAQYIAGWKVEIAPIAADCNADGVITTSDAVLLAQYIAGWGVKLG